MKLKQGDIKRLGIYFFFDKEGIADSYVGYFLEDLIKNLERLIVVSNGSLTEKSMQLFQQFTKEIIVRENQGLDVWAYKTALEYVGWEICATYDEIVLCNCTSMGPVYPFSEMFSNMWSKDVDFWGITKVYQMKEFDFGCNPYGYLPEHIQSFFMVYRKKFIKSAELVAYWANIPNINSYNESVGLHESVFTKYFGDKGFKWDVYVETDGVERLTKNPLMYYPMKLIKECRCPIFKRRSFFHDYADAMLNTTGESTILLYDYLRDSNIYDVNLIWDNILRCYNHSAIARQMHLNYTLSTKVSNPKRCCEILKNKKIALIMHLYFEDLIESSYIWATQMPASADIYITTDTEKKKRKIEKTFGVITCRSLEIRVIENRGRDVSALLVGVGKDVKKYDFVCFFHDKKAANVEPGSVGESFAYKCFANLLYNRCYVENVIELFEENPRLGLAVPPPPNHGIYGKLYGHNWSINFDNTKKLCDTLGINVPMSSNADPIAPYGTEFWFRPKAMAKLFEKDWKYEDFPEEPLRMDGTIAHAIERCYQFVAQDAGYYSAVIMSDHFQRIEYTNLNYYLMNDNSAHELRQQLSDVYESTSWKVSKPVRVFGEAVKKAGKRNNSMR